MLPQLSAKHIFFTGKGGVGKTTVACSLAVHLAEAGNSVLLISTDPASNIGQVLNTHVGSTITQIPDITPPGTLDAVDINPEEEAIRYRESILTPVRTILPPEVLKATEETLTGSCTVEVASFNRFTDFLTDPHIQDTYDRIIFDTAPTGHTLRLLSLPGDWASFIDRGAGDASCLGPLSGLEKNRQTYHQAVAALSDPQQTDLVLVTRAQTSTLQEASTSAQELSSLGINTKLLVVNGILPPSAATDTLSTAIYHREQELLRSLHTTENFPGLTGIETYEMALHTAPIMGIPQLRTFGKNSTPTQPLPHLDTPTSNTDIPTGLDHLITDLSQGTPKLILCMGKGGVGKTTVAQALAIGLARTGQPVHLSTTDPAAHLNTELAEELDNLTISTIDPHIVVEDYRHEVLETKGSSLDEDGRAQLDEDLRSPCTEEVAVFKAFSKVVSQAEDVWVVLDTAPTGHTLLLLDATGSYHRELMRQSGQDTALTTLKRLQDPTTTRPILVTLPETTPLLEAQNLADDLERAGITPWAWVINQNLTATPTQSPFLQTRAHAQAHALSTLHTNTPVVSLPVLTSEPSSLTELEELL